MKQKPVAWVDENNVLMYAPKPYQFVAFKENPDHLDDKQINWIPLYTEPQYRELSDEERLAFTKAYFNIHPEAHLSEQFKIKLYELNDFARAILKKASEK